MHSESHSQPTHQGQHGATQQRASGKGKKFQVINLKNKQKKPKLNNNTVCRSPAHTIQLNDTHGSLIWASARKKNKTKTKTHTHTHWYIMQMCGG